MRYLLILMLIVCGCNQEDREIHWIAKPPHAWSVKIDLIDECVDQYPRLSYLHLSPSVNCIEKITIRGIPKEKVVFEEADR